jgi:hypothetical protein
MTGQFEQTLNEFQKSIEGNQARLGNMLEVLNNRGFGALILIPCLIELFPTGMIPGVPSLCATIIILLSIQLAFGRRYPWIPDRFENKKFEASKIRKGIRKAKPIIRWIDRRSRPRWRGLINHTNERISSLFILCLALSMYPLELVPFASSIPALLISLIALSFITKDGILLITSWVLSAIGITVVIAIIYSTIL